MPVYGVGIVHSLKDEATFGEYRKVAAEALAKHRVNIVFPPSQTATIDGDDSPKAIVLLSFPTKAAAQAWRDDPELQDVHAMRNADPLTQGNFLHEFEKKICHYLGVENAFAVCNATAALEMAAQT